MKKKFIQPSAEIVCAEAQSMMATSNIESGGSNKGQGIVPEARQNNVLMNDASQSSATSLDF